MELQLTGPFVTDQLPRVAGEPVTITVARTVKPGCEALFLAWQSEMVAAVMEQPGCLGATVLHPGPDGGAYQTVFRFADGLFLRAWERSEVRADLMDRGSHYVTEERIQRTVGVESWFRAPSHAEKPRPWWKRLLVETAWVYPLSLIMSLFVAPGLMALPIIARVLVSSVLFYLVARITIGPLRRHLRSKRTLT